MKGTVADLLILLAFCISLGLAPWAPLSAVDPCRPTVAGPGTMPYGATLGDWGARWWQWFLEIETPRSPIVDPTGDFCHEGQAGPVFFLAGNLGGQTHRACTVGSDKALFFPILNSVFWEPTDCQGCDACRGVADVFMDKTSVVECEIDGIPLENPFQYRDVSSSCFALTIPANNPFGVAPGTYDPAFSDGFWVMLEPLCAGPHKIRFKGVVGPPTAPDFDLEVSYDLVVVPPFRRGESNGDGKVDLSDAVTVLNFLFLGISGVTCQDAGDTNDDGKMDLSDAVYLLGFLFLGGPAPPAPGHEACGPDLTTDGLADCEGMC
ncbi:MAG: hypothetical protein HY721_26980 [Planctomycetes bacterium]|nr:hypothetical protein [Planctomycetota bacterium]